jgi:hypothetical protein
MKAATAMGTTAALNLNASKNLPAQTESGVCFTDVSPKWAQFYDSGRRLSEILHLRSRFVHEMNRGIV